MCIYIRYSMSIIEKVFHYEGNEISVIKVNGEIWFKARDVSLALGCKSISDHVDPEDRIALGQLKKGVTKRNPLFHKNEQESTIFLIEAGLYLLVLQSKLPFAREFTRWIVKDVLPNIRKSGNYCLSNTKQCFNRQLCFKIMDERDLHIKVISYIRNNHPNAILCAGLGELQDSSTIRSVQVRIQKSTNQERPQNISILCKHIIPDTHLHTLPDDGRSISRNVAEKHYDSRHDKLRNNMAESITNMAESIINMAESITNMAESITNMA